MGNCLRCTGLVFALVIQLGCSGVDETPSGEGGPTKAAASAMSAPPAMSYTTLAQVLDPANLKEVRRYVDTVMTYVRTDPEQFPAWETDVVELCEGCEVETQITITPVLGSELLRPDDFPGKIRVLARVYATVLPPDTGTSQLKSLGLVYGNAEKRSYQLVIGNAVHFIYFDGTKFVASPVTWTFKANEDRHQLHYAMARWHSIPHINHLSGTWVACLEGCCTSQPVH